MTEFKLADGELCSRIRVGISNKAMPLPLRKILLTAQGKKLITTRRRLATSDRVLLLCVDTKGLTTVHDIFGTEEISVGDFVLMEARLPECHHQMPGSVDSGVLGDENSNQGDRQSRNRLLRIPSIHRLVIRMDTAFRGFTQR